MSFIAHKIFIYIFNSSKTHNDAEHRHGDIMRLLNPNLKNLGSIFLLSASAVLLNGCSDGDNGESGANGSGQVISLLELGRTESQGFAVSAAEIVAFDKGNQRVFTVNADSGAIDVFSASNLALPTLLNNINLKQMLADEAIVADVNLVGPANSIAVSSTYVAVAVEANPKTDNGWVVFLNLSDLSFASAVQVGALPDMLTFTPDGSKVIVANEGEPNIDYSIDPEGSISVISLPEFSLTSISFTDFNEGESRNSELPSSKMVIDGYNATVAQSVEPEYITLSKDGSEAYVSLQENNAIAVVDMDTMTIDRIFGLGFKDYAIPGNELDAGDKDSGVNIKNWPVMGIYMPDTITNMTFNGKTYLLTANEGDSREDWLENVTDQASCESKGYFFEGGGCHDEVRVKDLVGDAGLTLGSALVGVDNDENLGRLRASYHTTFSKNGGTVDKVFAYGGRSFSIWDVETGTQVFDSGSDFERITALRFGEDFNNNNDENGAESRSDDKGPEPEALAVGTINGHQYAFIGLERMGGIMVYDISNPFAPSYVQYINNRDLTIEPSELTDAGDLGPESIQFVSADDSPNSNPLIIVGNEVSGTTTIYQVDVTLLQDEN